jgi:DUSAM domain-containing protein
MTDPYAYDNELFPTQGEWERLRGLCRSLELGERIIVNEELVEYIQRVARQVGISAEEISAAAGDAGAQLALARSARRRIRDGSQKLMIAVSGALAALEDGDRGKARELLEQIIREEAVPWYREQARRQIVNMGLEPMPVT